MSSNPKLKQNKTKQINKTTNRKGYQVRKNMGNSIFSYKCYNPSIMDQELEKNVLYFRNLCTNDVRIYHDGKYFITYSYKIRRRKIAAAHSGTYHLDELLALGMQIYLIKVDGKKCVIVRTRDPEILDECDYVFDVGKEYNPETNRYDHHMAGFYVTMPNRKTKLSSAGLFWLNQGKELISKFFDTNNQTLIEKLWYKIYDEYIEQVDAHDNGIAVADEMKFSISSKASMISNPSNASEEVIEQYFYFYLQKVICDFFEYLLKIKSKFLPESEIIEQAFADRLKYDESGKILVLPKYCSWKEHLFDIEKENGVFGNTLFVIFFDKKDNTWRISAVPKELKCFGDRVSLPNPWCGLADEKLSEVCGVEDCTFVHASGFIGGNKTFEGALQMAKLAIEFYKTIKTIILYVGPPGCGKSTHAKEMADRLSCHSPLETDKLQVDENGDYKFQPYKLKDFHDQNIKKCEEIMESEEKNVIVSNTNLTLSALKPYVLLAIKHGYDVKILFPEHYSSNENPIWVNGKLNCDLIYKRREESEEDAGKQFTSAEKKIPKGVLERMIQQFYDNYQKMTVENILSAEDLEKSITKIQQLKSDI